MSPDRPERMAAALSPREEWLLFCWMAKHPRAVLEDTTTDQSQQRSTPGRRAPLAYAVGLAVGTLWVLVRRWW